jgi:hypothetical protein
LSEEEREEGNDTTTSIAFRQLTFEQLKGASDAKGRRTPPATQLSERTCLEDRLNLDDSSEATTDSEG